MHSHAFSQCVDHGLLCVSSCARDVSGVVKLTDVAWGERKYKTKRLLADKDMEWPTPPHFDFVRLEGTALVFLPA